LSRAGLFKQRAPRWSVHVLLGISFVISLFLFSKLYVAAGAIIVTLCSVIVEFARLRVPAVQRWLELRLALFLRPEEQRHLTGATYFFIGATITSVAFSRNVAALAILFLTFGDPAAAVIGTWRGRTKPLERMREGNLACLVACAVIAVVMNVTTHEPALLAAEVGAVFGTICQALPWRVNDNLTIPIGSAAAVSLTAVILRAI
jgi:dolichol kinase